MAKARRKTKQEELVQCKSNLGIFAYVKLKKNVKRRHTLHYGWATIVGRMHRIIVFFYIHMQ